MCIFSFHLSDSFQELGISPNLGWIPSRPAGAEVPPRWQTLDGIKALSHRLALIHGSPVPAALAWCSHLLQELGQQHLNPQELPSEVTSYQAVHWWRSGMGILRSGEGDRESRLFAQSQIQQLLRNTNLKKNPKNHCIQETAEIAGLAGGCLPLKLFQLLQGEGFLYNYLQFWICLGLGFFGFLCFLNLSKLPKGVPGTI